ncbi:MAG: hypothetical protein WCC72_03930 [Dehalococcoidales bacterium]|jgi:hypothetical protein
MSRPLLLNKEQKEHIFILKSTAKKKGWTLTSTDVINGVKEFLVKKEKALHPLWTIKEIEKYVEEEQLSPSAIIAYLTEVNHLLEEIKPIDEEWTLAIFNNKEYGSKFTPSSLPYLLRIKDWCNNIHSRLTIRQAIWIERLHEMPHFIGVRERLSLPDEKLYKDMWRVAYFLSAYEVVCELTKTEPDFRPFEASSLARMAQIGRDYMIQHYEEMFKALWQSEIDEGEEK